MALQFNKYILQMKPSASMETMAKAKKLKAQDPEIIDLAGGEPDFDTPKKICDELFRQINAGFTHYTVGPGLPELRQRIRRDGIVEYDRCLSSHTVALPDGTYCYCTLDCAQPLGAFLPAAQAEVARVKAAPSLDDGADPDELFFVSSLPWLTFSAISLPTPTPADSNPRITFGKFTQKGDRVLLPVNLTANHALVDGLHLAAFFDGMALRAAHPEEYF